MHFFWKTSLRIKNQSDRFLSFYFSLLMLDGEIEKAWLSKKQLFLLEETSILLESLFIISALVFDLFVLNISLCSFIIVLSYMNDKLKIIGRDALTSAKNTDSCDADYIQCSEKIRTTQQMQKCNEMIDHFFFILVWQSTYLSTIKMCLCGSTNGKCAEIRRSSYWTLNYIADDPFSMSISANMNDSILCEKEIHFADEDERILLLSMSWIESEFSHSFRSLNVSDTER